MYLPLSILLTVGGHTARRDVSWARVVCSPVLSLTCRTVASSSSRKLRGRCTACSDRCTAFLIPKSCRCAHLFVVGVIVFGWNLALGSVGRMRRRSSALSTSSHQITYLTSLLLLGILQLVGNQIDVEPIRLRHPKRHLSRSCPALLSLLTRTLFSKSPESRHQPS